ncbi:Putative ribonuclease H protein At1g65750 [Linum perenne]
MGLRDGAETNLWLERWVDGSDRLIDLTFGSTSAIDVDQPVAAFVTANGEWNWSLFNQFLSRDGCLQVAGMSPPSAGGGEDRITWGLERDGCFRICSAYLLVADEEGGTLDSIWRLIWRWKGPQRIRQFLWLVAHNRLLTNFEHHRRHLVEFGACQAWMALVGDTLDKDRFISHTGPPTRTGEHISWEPAPPEWVTLNSDGSVLSEYGQAATGGLIRNSQGRCLAAFSMNLGKCSITRAELRGAMSGLQLAWERCYRKIQLQLNSQCAIQLLQAEGLDDHAHAATIIKAIELLQRNRELGVSEERLILNKA